MDACSEIYAQSRSSVESCIAWLVEERKRDAFDSPLVRLPFEAAGGGAQAPTFSL